MAVVTFNYTVWLATYPDLSFVTQPTAQAYFDKVAALYIDNTDMGMVNIPRRTYLLGLLVAHLAQLSKNNAGSGGSLAGRISSASEGSVSVSTEYTGPAGMAWFALTSYGQEYIQATAGSRLFRYVGAPRSVYDLVGRSGWPWL